MELAQRRFVQFQNLQRDLESAHRVDRRRRAIGDDPQLRQSIAVSDTVLERDPIFQPHVLR
ncbi:MAG: hypothetical protein EXR27_19625 [Betaproteobacteria bacterium]|nr:hypothetical protein [Betaproteobacteria bacterium]